MRQSPPEARFSRRPERIFYEGHREIGKSGVRPDVRALVGLGWLIFALLLIAGGWLMLTACELRPLPLFGYAYCPRPSPLDALVPESERERGLRSRLKSAEARLATLPTCQPTATPEPPRAPTPNPSASPAPTPSPTPAPSASPTPEVMKMPRRISDLKGCWRSERGDIEIVSDDEQQKLIGKVRICYCLGENGTGAVLENFTDSDTCKGALRAKLEPNRLSMHHDRLGCSGNKGGIVPEDIICRGDSGEAVTCDTTSLGRMTGLGPKNERFQRVAAEDCRPEGN
jgi:hypothetical protein